MVAPGVVGTERAYSAGWKREREFIGRSRLTYYGLPTFFYFFHPFYPNKKETTVTNPTLEKAFGYQGDNMNLPVRDLVAALPFYENVLGFRVVSRGDTPHNAAVLARDQVQIGLAENGGDPTQDGCAFHVKDVEGLFAEFKVRGLQKETKTCRQ